MFFGKIKKVSNVYQPKFYTLRDAVLLLTQERDTRSHQQDETSSAGAAFTCQSVQTPKFSPYFSVRGCQGDGKRNGWQFSSIFSHQARLSLGISCHLYSFTLLSSFLVLNEMRCSITLRALLTVPSLITRLLLVLS